MSLLHFFDITDPKKSYTVWNWMSSCVFIALNLNHSIGDGNTYHNIIKATSEQRLRNIPVIHKSADNSFKDFLETIHPDFYAVNSNIGILNQERNFQKMIQKPLLEKTISNFTVYDKKTGKIYGMGDNTAFQNSLKPFGD